MRQASRFGIFKNILGSKKVTNKVKDIYITTLLPERKWIPFSKKLNTLFTSFLLFCQTGKVNNSSDIIWIYWIQAYLFARKINIRGRYIFDIDHNIIDDDNLPEGEKVKVANTLTDIGEKSEYILSASRSMIKWFEAKGFSNCLTARNGIDPSRFQQNLPVPQDLKEIPHPRILYVGTLSKWINTNLLLTLIKQHHEWNFIFIGGNYKTGLSEKLKNMPNVTLLGFKPAGVVPSYMANVDVGLGMYKDVEWMDVDSMKFYEYLAANIPVVTTNYHPHIKSDFDQLILSSNKLPEIEKMIGDILKKTGQSGKDWGEKAKSFVNNNTWDKRICEIMDNL